MGLAIPAYFLIVDFPDKATFLTAEQTSMIMGRINAEREDATPDELTFKTALVHLGDYKMWLMGLMFMAATTGSCELPFCRKLSSDKN